ncbi:MFS transporter [Cupriavidus sp. TMH.W2]|uniref:MFS transporter n=1 Tax=Cupriavidus sp. TMH.W2 TaxID=3434465 RepID=UPI003D78AA1D
MDLSTATHLRANPDDYLFGKRQAWFAFVMTVALMLADYIDRQVIVSLFPHLKLEWGLSDKQLGALVSAVSVTVAAGAVPIALWADRGSRVKSIVVMATAWSLACISCMFTRNYSQLLIARAVVGVGEAGYGSVGAALLTSHFPARMRSALMGAFFAAGSFGSVLGVMLGGVIAAHWGWRAAFGVVGIPGLALALLYMFVRDYRTVALSPRLDQATQSLGSSARAIVAALTRSPSMLWVCLGSSAQVIVLSTVWAWLPSYLNRTRGLPPEKAAVSAALVVLCGAVGAVLWGAVVDRSGRHRPRNKLTTVAVLCLLSMAMLMPSLGGTGLALAPGRQLAWIAVGGLLMTCTAGPAVALVLDVVHPGIRATAGAVLAIFLNLFGLAAGPFIAGVLSDLWTLPVAMAIMPAFSVLAALGFLVAARTYERDVQGIREQVAAETVA